MTRKERPSFYIFSSWKKTEKNEHCKLTSRSLYRNDSVPDFMIHSVVDHCGHACESWEDEQDVHAAALKTAVTYNIYNLQ